MKPMLVLVAAVAAIACLTEAMPAFAARDYEAAKVAAARAKTEMARGGWDEAQRQLGGAYARCEPSFKGRPCRMLLDFNLGYLYERWARAAPEQQQALLSRSAQAYRRVLDDAPNHAETINNLSLVLRDLGQTDELKRLLADARSAKPEQAARTGTLIGDDYAARGEWAKALEAYADAAELDPDSERPRQKMIEAYRNSNAPDVGRFLERLKSWESSFPELAADGYRTVVVTGAERDGKLVERALLRWVAVTSEQRSISSVHVERQFKGTRLPQIGELHRFLGLVETIPPDRAPGIADVIHDNVPRDRLCAAPWWRETLLRRNALAQAALALGRFAIVNQDPKRAEASFAIGAACGPPPYDYEHPDLAAEQFVYLDTMTELAWLQYRYPKGDPGETKLNLIVDELFHGKSQAYQAKDRDAIRRHHVVLGQLYAAKGVWGNESDPRGAIFQLKRAVDDAEDRSIKQGIYEPMAELKALLGEGYERTGNKIGAQERYIDAAEAFLDGDDVDRSSKLLQRAKQLDTTDSGASERKQRLQATEQILNTRRDVKVLREQLDKGASAPPSPAPDAKWLSKGTVSGLDNDFLRRQQFKVNADLAEQAAKAQDTEESGRRAKAALNSANDVSALVGTADILRLKQAGSLATKGRDGAAEGTESMPTKDRTWQVKLPSASQPVNVKLKE